MNKLSVKQALEKDLANPPMKLPDGRDYKPVPHQIPIDVVIRLSESRLALINGRPGAAEERWARSAPEPFQF